MDPVSAVGLAGALVGIGDVITRSIRSLIDLQSKYRSSSLVVSLLIGQLTTLKAALNQITEWVGNSLVSVPQHEQLVADLQASLGSCHVLIFVLEERIEKLEQEQDHGDDLTVKGKIGFLLEESSLNEFTNHLNNQVNALNLLLTALNCRTTFERNELLCHNESRQIIKRVKDNSTSLLSLRDTGSQYTRMSIVTQNWSLLDREFDFDQEVLTTDIYRAAWRSSIRKDTITRKGKMHQLHETLVERVRENVEEDSEGSPQPQTKL
jgi:chaperonin cofactor prefoldin